MAATAPRTPPQLPDDLIEAIEHGVLTQEQIKALIRHDAKQLGLGYDEALEAARRNQLPRTPLGFDLRFLVRMLAA